MSRKKIVQSTNTITSLHKKFIQNTIRNGIVKECTVYMCAVRKIIRTHCSIRSKKVFITSLALKHMYDKRPAIEYDFLLKNLAKIVRNPDFVRKNSVSKRGSYCFVKRIRRVMYTVSLEDNVVYKNENCSFIVTAFKTDRNYLKKFPLIWSRRDGNPSS